MKKPSKTSTKTSQAIELLSRNPGLTVEAAAQFVGITTRNLSRAIAVRQAREAGRCPTCFRLFRPTNKRPLPVSHDTDTLVLAPDAAYHKMTVEARRLSRTFITQQKRADRVKALVARAIERAEAKINKQTLGRAKYKRHAKWRLLTVKDFADVL